MQAHKTPEKRLNHKKNAILCKKIKYSQKSFSKHIAKMKKTSYYIVCMWQCG
jgi:hypothetical protein